MAAEALGRYKLRTSLSVLGVVLGVAAVIAMMSVSEGARREALNQVEQLGLDNLVARNRPPPGPGTSSSGLTAGDTEKLMELVPGAREASPVVERFMPVSYFGNGLTARIVGTRPDYQTILRLRADRGRLLSVLDDRLGARVSVLGARLARTIFRSREPVGEFVRVQGEYYKVVGVLADQGADPNKPGTLAWRDLNETAIVPLSTLVGRGLEIAPTQRVDEIWIQASDGGRVEEVGQVLRQTFNRLHGTPDVEVVIPRELLAQRYRTQRTFSVVVGSVAVLALIVGGIGIMNIMLTSVVERTHEIGIRRTVGATRKDVAAQFLTESLLMTVSGGALGIVIGALVSWAITGYAGWSTYISPLAIGLAFAVSVAVGLGFGLYPAIMAARLEPVDAVRYE
jgi:putative ABC transport system permease protein